MAAATRRRANAYVVQAMVLTAVGVSVTAQRQTSGMRRRRTVCASLDSMDPSANRPIAPITAPWAVLVTRRRASVLVMILIAAQIAARRSAQVTAMVMESVSRTSASVRMGTSVLTAATSHAQVLRRARPALAM